MSHSEFLQRQAQERLHLLAQEREKATMIEIAHDRLAIMPPHFTYEEYLTLCDEVGAPEVTSFPLPQGPDIARHLALTALPRIFPEIHPVHFAADTETHELPSLDQQELTHLPEQIHGVPLAEVLGLIANGIPLERDPEKRADRIYVAHGRCSTTSDSALDKLTTAHEALRPFAYTRQIAPAFRPTIPGDLDYPKKLTPLGYKHSLIAIPYVGHQGPMELLVDPTVAYVDQTQRYDLEVTAVPELQVPTYLRLRYSAYPQDTTPHSIVHDRHPFTPFPNLG